MFAIMILCMCVYKFTFYFRHNVEPIEAKSMPGVVQYGVLNIENGLKPIIDKGLKSILLFGVAQEIPKVKKNMQFKNERLIYNDPVL